MDTSTWALAVTFLVAAFWYFHQQVYGYWSSRGVPSPRPWPFFGNFWNVLGKSPMEFEKEWLNKYGKVYGIYVGLKPHLTIADAELIKQVMIKDFPTFINRRVLNIHHDIVSKSLFDLENGEWKRIRSIVTPIFTSGKLKGMSQLMMQSVDKLDDYLGQVTNGDQTVELETKKVLAGFTIDVIASTTFATNVNSNGPERDSVLVRACMGLFKFNLFKAILAMTLPLKLNNLLGIRTFFPESELNYLLTMLNNVVHQKRLQQKEGGSQFKGSKDVIQLLLKANVNDDELNSLDYGRLTSDLDAKQQQLDDSATKTETVDKPENGQLRQLTQDEIVAQCFILFIAGFETTASTLNYLFFEMSRNQKIQDRLVHDLNKAMANVDEVNDPEGVFDAIMTKVPYLDACIKETLRKYPPVTRLDRRVGDKNGYDLGGIHLDYGTLVEISAHAVHHNPEYYPNPEEYDPERFMPENKDKLVPYTYLPFGLGPRNCVGNRFAYQELKMCIGLILPKYRISPSVNTPEKLSFQAGGGLLVPVCTAVNVSRRS